MVILNYDLLQDGLGKDDELNLMCDELDLVDLKLSNPHGDPQLDFMIRHRGYRGYGFITSIERITPDRYIGQGPMYIETKGQFNLKTLNNIRLEGLRLVKMLYGLPDTTLFRQIDDENGFVYDRMFGAEFPSEIMLMKRDFPEERNIDFSTIYS